MFEKVFGIEKSKTEVILKKVIKGLLVDSKENQGNKIPINQEKAGGLPHQREDTFSKKNESLENVDSALKKFRKKVINSKTDVVELTKNISLVDMLNGAYMMKHHKILLPLVILKANQTTDQFSSPDLIKDLKNPTKTKSLLKKIIQPKVKTKTYK